LTPRPAGRQSPDRIFLGGKMGIPLLLSLIVAWALSASPALALPAERDPAAVRAVLAAQQAAWNRGDLEAYMHGYWKSDSLVFFGGGEVTRGWRATLERYTRRYKSEGRAMGRLALEVQDVTILAPGQALARGAWKLALPEGSRRGLFTLWLRYFRRAGWRIVHDHSSTAS
jgi:uncharacterized protein (TIGR02246 family)